MVEDRHIEAAIEAAELLPAWDAKTVRLWAYCSPPSVVAETARSILAHAETLARVEAALDAIDWEASRENGNLTHFKRCVHVQLSAALQPKDTQP